VGMRSAEIILTLADNTVDRLARDLVEPSARGVFELTMDVGTALAGRLVDLHCDLLRTHLGAAGTEYLPGSGGAIGSVYAEINGRRWAFQPLTLLPFHPDALSFRWRAGISLGGPRNRTWLHWDHQWWRNRDTGPGLDPADPGTAAMVSTARQALTWLFPGDPLEAVVTTERC
jgi:hypothetical protein